MTDTRVNDAAPAEREPARARMAQRIPLNTLAIGFGLAGLAAVWTTAGRLLGAPAGIAQAFWAVAAVAWVWLIVAHLRRGAKSSETLRAQLRHPAQGPIAALVPVVGMLLGADLHRFVPVAGEILVIVSMVAAAAFAAWILAFWHAGNLTPEAFHGGYLLPTVAGGLIAATTAYTVGLPGVAVGAFAVGIFFWIVISTVLLARLAFFPPLPAALTPTCAILLAPPAVAGTAWFTINGEHADLISTALLGLLVVMALQQLALLPRYRKLPFTLGFWSFTFPLAAAAGYGVDWLAIAAFPGWQAVAWLLVALATVVIAAIGVRSLWLVTSVRRGVRRAEGVLRRADELVERG
mgnify:CR=1 FL=1